MLSTRNSVSLKSASSFPSQENVQELNKKDARRESLDSVGSTRYHPQTPDNSCEPTIKHAESTGSITSHSHPFETGNLAKVVERTTTLNSHSIELSDSEDPVEQNKSAELSSQRTQATRTPFAAQAKAAKAFSMPCVLGGYLQPDGSRTSPFIRTASDELDPLMIDFDRPVQQIRGNTLVRTSSEVLTNLQVRQLTGHSDL